MTFDEQADEMPALDEGSWVYLIGSADDQGATRSLHGPLIEACEASGWTALSWSPPGTAAREADPGRFFEGVRHAVEHADVVIALMGKGTETADAELALAYSHRRPIIGLQMSSEESRTSGIQDMLSSYERARVITYENANECVSKLQATFSDPSFAETIRRAAGEHAGGP
jgi:diketogulonate reductase-like aldo/keto reductase